MTGSDEEIEGALSRGDGGGAAGEETVDWEGYEVWKGHLSDGAMKAIMSGGKDLALKAIGEEFGKMGDDVRRRMGSMDYAVGAQEDGEDQVTLFTGGLENLGQATGAAGCKRGRIAVDERIWGPERR